MERLTISGLPEDVKREYVKWCVDNTAGDLSAIVKTFIHWIADVKPGVDEIVSAMEEIKWSKAQPDAQEEG